jgi:hypothetical protein
LFPPSPSAPFHLSLVQRAAIVAYAKEGKEEKEICSMIPCSIDTVKHWITHYNKFENVNDERKCGRPLLLDEVTQSNIITQALDDPHHSTPKQIKRKLAATLSNEQNTNNNDNNNKNKKKKGTGKEEGEENEDNDYDNDYNDESVNVLSNVSPRTIRRTLDHVCIFGRVAVKEPDFTAEHIRKRLSFAEGYAGIRSFFCVLLIMFCLCVTLPPLLCFLCHALCVVCML